MSSNPELEEMIEVKSKQKLFDEMFLENVKTEIVKLKPVSKFIDQAQNSNCTLASAFESWLKLGEIQEIHDEWIKRN